MNGEARKRRGVYQRQGWPREGAQEGGVMDNGRVMTLRLRLPTPTVAQVRAWLLAHGWTEDNSGIVRRYFTKGAEVIEMPHGGQRGVETAFGWIVGAEHIPPQDLYRQITGIDPSVAAEQVRVVEGEE